MLTVSEYNGRVCPGGRQHVVSAMRRAASLFVTYLFASACCYRIAVQNPLSATATATKAPIFRSRRPPPLLRPSSEASPTRRPSFSTTTGLGAFLYELPCPTSFRCKCNTTSARPEIVRRQPIHCLHHGSGKLLLKKPDLVYYACTLRASRVCAQVAATGGGLLQRHVLTQTSSAWQRHAA